MVDYNPIPIINIPDFGDLAAPKIVEDLKINSQNDKEKLKQAKELVYQKGFYGGTLIVGKYKGKSVIDAKPLVKADMIEESLACLYYEPESIVISRSGEECIVSLCD